MREKNYEFLQTCPQKVRLLFGSSRKYFLSLIFVLSQILTIIGNYVTQTIDLSLKLRLKYSNPGK